MAKGPWSEITEFPPEEPAQSAANKAIVRESVGQAIANPKTAVMLDIRTPRWWLPWERMTAVRMWTRQGNRWRNVAYFWQPIQAMNYAEVLAHSIAEHHNMGIVGETDEQAASTADDPFAR